MPFAIVGGHGLPLELCVGLAVAMIWFGSGLALGLWVMQDARRRAASDSWSVLVILFNFVGLLLYLGCRPDGPLAWCPRCHREVLDTLDHCPHCGHEPPPKRPAAHSFAR